MTTTLTIVGQFTPQDPGSPTAQEQLMHTNHRHFVLSQVDAFQVRSFSEVDPQTAATWLENNGYPDDANKARDLENWDPKDEI